jgi:penicillin amidase
MRRTATARAIVVTAALLTGAAAPATAATRGADPRPPAERLAAVSALPPGESGFFSSAAESRYQTDHRASDFGPHVDDQRHPYWHFHYEPDGFARPTGTATRPASGVRIYRDAQGVPLVYGRTGRDVWFGAGYAAATDRLFEMDAVRRLAEGTLAELTGAGSVPADLQERILTYTRAEYHRMFTRLPAASRAAISGYAAGVETRIRQVNADPQDLAPGEDVVLSTDTVDPAKPQTVADWTVRDTLAAGVYITRTIASQGGDEMDNVAALRRLQHRYGRHRGTAAFDDLFTDNDPKAVVTVPGRHFSNLPAGERSARARRRARDRAERWAATLPSGLRTGAGTGDSAVPSGGSAAPAATTPYAASVLRAAHDLEAWRHRLHGGSFAYAVSGARTHSGHPMLASNPQLAYSYPSELWELEVHGGGYDARGVSVPGLPTVGIGHTGSVAWGLTTGYSKTIDSFIEKTRPAPGGSGPPQYRHDGRWHPENCRHVTVHYRAASPQGVPAGPGVGPTAPKETHRVCHTDHGPVVATAEHGRLARTVDYAMWHHEVDTITGILDWDRARTLADVRQGVRHVTWNENMVAADAHHIGYWHPGRYFRRAPGTDQRFPLRGTGSQDERGLMPFRDMPHVVDPADGYLANWNTKPAHGWYDGDLSGTNTRPGGPANRLVEVERRLRHAHRATARSMDRWDRHVGESDDRAPAYLPVIVAERHDPALDRRERRAVRLLAGWNGLAYDPGHGSSRLGTPAGKVTDGPAPTLFAAFVTACKAELFGSLPASIRARLDTEPADGTHAYDLTPLDNEALRVLRPHFSAHRPLARWSNGRSRARLVRHALAAAIHSLRSRDGRHMSAWRRPHAISAIDSLSGVVGPSKKMPFEDRGTWVQHVALR